MSQRIEITTDLLTTMAYAIAARLGADATCDCGCRFAWSGGYRQRPACPKCGDRPPQAEIDEVSDYIRVTLRGQNGMMP